VVATGAAAVGAAPPPPPPPPQPASSTASKGALSMDKAFMDLLFIFLNNAAE
jgi:hypothetical protein